MCIRSRNAYSRFNIVLISGAGPCDRWYITPQPLVMQVVDVVEAILCRQAGLKSLRDSNLIPEKHFGSVAFPATVAAGGDHESRGVVDVELGDGSGAVTGDDEEGNSRMARCLFMAQVVQT